MATGETNGAHGEVRTPTVFRSFLEVSGDRVTPSTLSKATLTDLSHTLEELVLIDDVPGTVLTGFQESQHWHAERLRYEALATGEQRSVAVFARGQLGRATHVRRFALERGHPLAQEWFLFVLSERFSAALFGRELPDQNPAEEMDRQFASIWTFDPAVLGDLLTTLKKVAATVSGEAAETVRRAVEDFPPRTADPSVQQRFVNAVFERLESGRQQWRRTSHELLATRRAIEKQYRRLIDLERLAATGTVAASVAHDLNNPLATITMAATTLPSVADPHERARLADIVEREALRAGRITQGLLAFVSDRDPVRRIVSLPTLLANLIEGYGLADDPPMVGELPQVSIEVDPDRFRQVLANLIDNGLAVPGRVGPVKIDVTREAGDLVLRVEDDGDGFPPDVADRAFTPFVTTKSAGHGTGLGLSIARRHAQDHGGTIAIERTGPHGTVMIVRLPGVVVGGGAEAGGDARVAVESKTGNARDGLRSVSDTPSAPDDGSAPADAATAAEVERSSMSPRGSILVVDDEAGVRGLLEALLRRDGWEVTSVGSGAEAIDAVRGASFDVTLLDVGRDGQRLLDQLDEHDPGLASRSAFMTGSPPSDGLLDGRPVLGKPFVWQELAALLRTIDGRDEPDDDATPDAGMPPA